MATGAETTNGSLKQPHLGKRLNAETAMDWESVLNHVERRRQLDLSSDEEEEDSKRNDGRTSHDREERKGNQKKHLVHTDSVETQSTRLSEDSVDDNNTEPFTVMDTVKEEEEEEAKRRRESAMLSGSTVRWMSLCNLYLNLYFF